MIPDRAAWLLAHPLDGPCDISPYRWQVPQPDGAVLIAILAVDR